MHRIPFLTTCCFWLLMLVGCPKPSNTVSTTLPSIDEAVRPPLRILIPKDFAIGDKIVRRWQTISDQRLDIGTYTPAWIDAGELPDSDILIAESRWLATLVERGAVSPLPKAVGQLASDNHSPEETLSLDGRWPWAWKRAATYGQRVWGLPLGVPLLVAISRGATETTSTPNRKSTVHTQAGEAATQRHDWLIDRFLILAAELNPQPSDTSILFQMTNGQSRLNQAWLIDATRMLRDRLGITDELAHEYPEAAWQRILDGRGEVGLGWPKVSSEDSSASDQVSIEAPKRWVDSGAGLIAIVTRKNRQSSTSIRFLKWLDAQDQRLALGEDDNRVQPGSETWPVRSERHDIRRYDEVLRRGLDDRLALSELQFAEAALFRERLNQALQRIVQDPSAAAAEMNQCHVDWNQMATRIGSETMKQRLALAYSLDKIKEN